MSGTVKAVFGLRAYNLFAAAFAHRTADKGQLFHTVRADQISFRHDNFRAHRAPAGIEKIQKAGIQTGQGHYWGHDSSL